MAFRSSASIAHEMHDLEALQRTEPTEERAALIKKLDWMYDEACDSENDARDDARDDWDF